MGPASSKSQGPSAGEMGVITPLSFSVSPLSWRLLAQLIYSEEERDEVSGLLSEKARVSDDLS